MGETNPNYPISVLVNRCRFKVGDRVAFRGGPPLVVDKLDFAPVESHECGPWGWLMKVRNATTGFAQLVFEWEVKGEKGE